MVSYSAVLLGVDAIIFACCITSTIVGGWWPTVNSADRGDRALYQDIVVLFSIQLGLLCAMGSISEPASTLSQIATTLAALLYAGGVLVVMRNRDVLDQADPGCDVPTLAGFGVATLLHALSLMRSCLHRTTGSNVLGMMDELPGEPLAAAAAGGDVLASPLLPHNEEGEVVRTKAEWPEGEEGENDRISAAAKAAATAAQQDAAEEKMRLERGFGTMKLLQLAHPHRWWLYAGCAALLFRLPFSLSMPHWVNETVWAMNAGDYDGARWNVVYLFVCGTVDALMDFWCVYLFGVAQQRIIRSLRLDLFRAILNQEVGFFDTHNTGEITSRLTADCAEMANDLTWVFRFTIEALVRIGGITGYMFYRSPRLGLLAFAVIPVTAVVNHFYSKWLHRNQQNVQTALADANTVAQEAIGAIRTVFSFAQQGGEHAKYAVGVERYYVLVVFQTFIQGIYYMFCNTFLINTCVQAALLLYGGRLVEHEDTTPAIVMAFMLYQGQLQEYFQNLFNSFTSLIKSSGAAAKVFEYIDRPPRYRITEAEPVDPTDDDDDESAMHEGVRGAERGAGRVAMRGVWFCYPSRPEVEVLRGVSLDAAPGEVVALVGSSGSGKSTCFHLMEHFYEAQSGAVTLDGADVATLPHGFLHRQIALVGQEPVLMSGSVLDNILYGVCDAADLRVEPEAWRTRAIAAARAANAHGFVMDLPDDYDTEVGERGTQLSGGQKQRLAIARCLVLNPSVLLLDEATSALDAESEAQVQAALETAMQGRTTLVIAHRLSTVRGADRIVMLHAGQVVEVGSHAELMAKPLPADGAPSYRGLVQRQATASVLE